MSEEQPKLRVSLLDKEPISSREFVHPVFQFPVKELIFLDTPAEEGKLEKRRVCWIRKSLETLTIEGMANPITHAVYLVGTPEKEWEDIALAASRRRLEEKFTEYWKSPKTIQDFVPS